MSQRQEGEKVIFWGTCYPSPARRAAPEPSEDLCRRISLSRLSSRTTPCQEGNGGQPHRQEPWPWLGAVAPSPGHPKVHAAGAWLDPSSTVRPGKDGLEHRTSPRTCTQLLFPWASFAFLDTAHTQPPCTPIKPGARSSPERSNAPTGCPASPQLQSGRGVRHGNA